ncbi:MAG: NADH-quinone oxidoreductase subunit NuoE [Acidobacteria bacterium]|nr:NADH-quinone oxidoreductase subunit NuoE [Acidobacteriota bacterium]
MLKPEEQQEIERELERYRDRRALCIEGLKIVQKHRGWISDEALADLGEFLGMTVEEIDGVATFYNLIYRRPVGRHVILVCDSVSCWIRGYEGLRDYLRSKLGLAMGETTPDNRFTLLPIVCLGACGSAPAMMVDNDLHVNLDPEKIDRILENYK